MALNGSKALPPVPLVSHQWVKRAPPSVLRNQDIIMPVGHSAHTTSASSGSSEHPTTLISCGAVRSEKGGRPSRDLTSTGLKWGSKLSHTSEPRAAKSMLPWTRPTAPGMGTLDQWGDVRAERPRWYRQSSKVVQLPNSP